MTCVTGPFHFLLLAKFFRSGAATACNYHTNQTKTQQHEDARLWRRHYGRLAFAFAFERQRAFPGGVNFARNVVKALEELSPGKTSTTAVDTTDDDGMRESVSAYLTVKLTDLENSLDTYDRLYRLDGIVSCDAVRGDFDIILLARGETMEEVQEIFDRVEAFDGLEVVSMSQCVCPAQTEPDVGCWVIVGGSPGGMAE